MADSRKQLQNDEKNDKIDCFRIICLPSQLLCVTNVGSGIGTIGIESLDELFSALMISIIWFIINQLF